MAVALLPRPDGPPLRLTPTLALWRALEREFCPPAPGPGLGALYLEHKMFRMRLDVCCALLYQAARAAGEAVDFTQIETAVAAAGLSRVHQVVDDLFEDLFRSRAPANEGAQPGTPLASGGSTPSSD